MPESPLNLNINYKLGEVNGRLQAVEDRLDRIEAKQDEILEKLPVQASNSKLDGIAAGALSGGGIAAIFNIDTILQFLKLK